MKTTLNQIRAKSPCNSGWTKLLKYLGKTKADDEPLSIIEIIKSNGLDDALWCLRAVEGHDKEIRLYAVWCARQIQHLMTDKRSIDALDVADRFANGEATQAELYAARAAAGDVAEAVWDAALAAAGSAGDAARDAARAAGAARAAALAAAGSAVRCAVDAAGDAARAAAWAAAWAARDAGAARAAAMDAQCNKLTEICLKIGG